MIQPVLVLLDSELSEVETDATRLLVEGLSGKRRWLTVDSLRSLSLARASVH